MDSKNLTPYKKPHGAIPEKRGPDKNHRGMASLKALITVEHLV